ncbi:hypothetical protein GGI1_02365 [Acidithiobacillus sp. GGI-221]|nr:hypothetical protein GGI1_02365 [Acidithiobacillus sp. GGI-221]
MCPKADTMQPIDKIPLHRFSILWQHGIQVTQPQASDVIKHHGLMNDLKASQQRGDKSFVRLIMGRVKRDTRCSQDEARSAVITGDQPRFRLVDLRRIALVLPPPSGREDA